MTNNIYMRIMILNYAACAKLIYSRYQCIWILLPIMWYNYNLSEIKIIDTTKYLSKNKIIQLNHNI